MDLIYGLRGDNSTNICPNGSYVYETLFPVSWRDHLGASISYLVGFFNILTIYMFVKAKDVMSSPVTSLLVLLAITDSLAALCSFLPTQVGILSDLIQREQSVVHYNYCLPYLIVTDLMFFIFHDFSVLITASVGIVKVLALRFPIYCNRSLKKRKVLAVVALFTPIVIVGEFFFVFEYTFVRSDDGWCCKYYSETGILKELRKAGMWIISIFYAISFVSMIGSTSYIVFKLTTQRFGRSDDNSTVHVSNDVRKSNYQSAIMLVLVTVIFLIADLLELIALFSMVLTEYYGVTSLLAQDWFVQMFAWQRYIAEIGYASNFFIYLLVSRHLRNALKSLVCKD